MEAFMADDDSSEPEKIEELSTRLDYLESVARETVARLYAIEKQLGLVFRAVPRELEKPAQSVDQRSRLDALEEAVRAKETPQKTQPDQVPAKKPPAVQPAPPESATSKPTVSEPISTPPLDKAPSVSESKPAATSLPEQTQQRPTPTAPPSTPTEARPSAPRAERSVLGVPAPQGAPPPTQKSRPAAPSIAPAAFAQRGDLEARIGGNWFNRIGIIAIFLGVTFFLKYAVDNQWIGPVGRVSIGAAVGIAFLILGERLRAKYASYAFGLTGGGVAVLYAAIWFASGHRYDLLSQPVAFALMAMVTASASLLAARYSALPIAVLGLIGGFLTPILLSTGVDNESGLFTYIALLDLGVLALAYSKQWRSLNYLAFVSTVLIFAAWMDEWYTFEKLATTVFFLTVLFAIFALLAVMYNVVNRRPTRWLDLGMVFSNAFLYFGTCYELLDDAHHAYLGLFALLVSTFYLVLGYFTFQRDRDDKLLVLTFLGLGFLFAVLAVPIQFDQHWVTMGWAIEGAVMSWIGLRANDRTSRYAALVVFGVAVAHWFHVDMQEFAYHTNETFLPLLNRRALSCAVLVAALGAAVWFYRKTATQVEEDERSMFAGLYILAANALAVILLSLDANDYFNQKKTDLPRVGFEKDQLDNTHFFTVSALWSLYGAGLLIVGIKRRLRMIRIAALVLLAGAILLVLALNLSYYSAPWHTLAFNPTFGSFALLIGALASGTWFYSKSKDIGQEERRLVLSGLIGAANVLAIVALSAEALGHFDRAQAIASGEAVAHLENAKQLALSAVWTIFAATALYVGVRRRSQSVRAGSLLLIGLAIAKALVVDLQYYDAGWHTLLINSTFAAFALLICALALGAWLYSRGEGISDEERGAVIPVLVGMANLLAVIAFSIEALGYFDRAQALTSGQAIARLENTKHLALTAVWTIFAAAALIAGIRRRSSSLRAGALVLLAIAIVKVALIDLQYYDAAWHTPLANATFASFGLLVIALAVGVWFYSRSDDIAEAERRMVIPILLGSANLLALVGLSAEVMGYFTQASLLLSNKTTEEISRLKNDQLFGLSGLWTVYGAAALGIAIRRGRTSLRWGAVILLMITTLKILALDSHFYDAEWHSLIVNQTFGSYLLLIAALATAIWFYSKASNVDEEEKRSMLTALIISVNVLAVVGLSLEALGHYAILMRAPGLQADKLTNLSLARQLSISLIWGIYGGSMLTVGIARPSRLLRLMALGLLGVTIGKVFFVDVWSYQEFYRFISFLVLGSILLAVSFLYQRYRKRVAQLIGADDARSPIPAEE